MSGRTVSAEARLRAKSQLTLPEPVVSALGIAEGDRFIVEVGEEPDTIRLHRIRSSYAGSMRGVYEDADVYVEGERRTWERG